VSVSEVVFEAAGDSVLRDFSKIPFDIHSSVCAAELLNVLVATDAYEMFGFCCTLLRASDNVILSVCFNVKIFSLVV